MKVAADAMTSAVGAAKDKTTELLHTSEQVRLCILCWWHHTGAVSYFLER